MCSTLVSTISALALRTLQSHGYSVSERHGPSSSDTDRRHFAVLCRGLLTDSKFDRACPGILFSVLVKEIPDRLIPSSYNTHAEKQPVVNHGCYLYQYDDNVVVLDGRRLPTAWQFEIATTFYVNGRRHCRPVSSIHDTTYVVCVLLLHAKSNSVGSSHLFSWPRRAQNWMRLRRYAFIGIAIVDPVMLVCPRSALGSATLAVTTCWLL